MRPGRGGGWVGAQTPEPGSDASTMGTLRPQRASSPPARPRPPTPPTMPRTHQGGGGGVGGGLGRDGAPNDHAMAPRAQVWVPGGLPGLRCPLWHQGVARVFMKDEKARKSLGAQFRAPLRLPQL